MGKNTKIKEGIEIYPIGKCHNFSVGENTFINTRMRVACGAKVRIGNFCSIGSNVSFETAGHSLSLLKNGKRSTHFSPITICDEVWLGARVTVLSGVTVNKGAVVAAGAVVTKDVAAKNMVAGVPAVVIKIIDDV